MRLGRVLVVVVLALSTCALPSYDLAPEGGGASGGGGTGGGAAGGPGGAGGVGASGGGGAGAGGGMGGAPWFDASYSHRKHLWLDTSTTTEDLAAFPVPVVLAMDDDLAAYAQSSGRDIFFTTASGGASAEGGQRLSHEIELFDGDTGQIVAWVKVPSIAASTDTELYVYFGNEFVADQADLPGTWPADLYRGVWHLGENPVSAPPQMRDSTTHGIDGTIRTGTSTPSSTAGIAGRALVFHGMSGNGDGLDMDDVNDDHLDPFGASFSVSCWMLLADGSAGGRVLDKFMGGPARGYQLTGTGGSWLFSAYDGTIARSVGLDSVPIASWAHVAFVMDRQQGSLNGYLNGDYVNTTSIDALGGVSNGQHLALSPGGGPFRGNVDELRLYFDALTDDWLALEHHSLTSSDFLTVGALESQ